MTPEAAQSQVLSSHLSSAMNATIAAQTEVLVLRAQLQAEVAKWRAKLQGVVDAETFEAICAEIG
jgi:hypothetical protein